MRNSGHTEDEGADVPDARNTYNLNRSFGRDAISVFAETDVRSVWGRDLVHVRRNRVKVSRDRESHMIRTE